MRDIETPTQKTCEDVAVLMGIELARTVKSIALMGVDEANAPQFVLALVRGRSCGQRDQAGQDWWTR